MLPWFLFLIILATASGADDTLQTQYIFPLQDKHVHGASIAETPGGDLLAVWFHGSGERTADDVRLLGARLRKGAAAWSEVFDMADTPGFPDCNPVLFVDTKNRLWLFWSVVLANRWENCLLKYCRADRYEADGPPEWNWQDVILLKADDTFPEKIAAGFKEINPPEDMWAEYARPYSELVTEAARDKLKRQLGWMTRNHPLVLQSGRILLPLYSDGFNICLTAYSDDDGANWQASEPIVGLGPIQPALAQRKDGSVVAFFRDSGDAPKRLQQAESSDEGKTWTVTRDTDIPNPSSSAEVKVLADGRWILVGNDLEEGRNRLGVLLSEDEGQTWTARRYLEEDADVSNAYAYPSILQASDGSIHAVYSCHIHEGRTIKHAFFSPAWVLASSEDGTPPDTTPSPIPVSAESETSAAALPESEAATQSTTSEVHATPESPLDGGMPDPHALLEKSAAMLATRKSLAFDFTAEFAYTNRGATQTAQMEGNVILGQGNRGMLHVKRSDSDSTTYNSDKGRIAYSPGLNRYATLPAVASRRELVAYMTPGTVEPALAWLADMFDGKPAVFDTLSITPGEREGVPCWDVHAEEQQYALQIALSRQEPHSIMVLEMTFKEPAITKYKFPADASLTITMLFANWKWDFVPPDSIFEFTPPAGTIKSSLEELSAKPRIDRGSVAPDFTLEKLDGGTVRLKDHIGQDVVVLEFWKTNCTVCQKMAPAMSEIAAAFSGQGVHFYSVNLRETPEAIQNFMKRENVSLPVLMDTNGQVGALYQVTGVPKVVVVGKDGLVKTVFSGMPADFSERLTSQLQTLLLEAPETAQTPPAMIVDGAPAPTFSLEQLDGGTVELMHHFGVDVVMLVFWATHCGYCRKSMPVIAETSAYFEGKDVVVYAVNQREQPEKIQTYFQEQNYSLPVLLDRTGSVGRLYEVIGIPKVVIIGKDGLIKSVSRGMSSITKENLTSQIERSLQ